MDYAIRTAGQLEPILKAFRKERGLSQVELAKKIDVTQQALSLLEAAPHRASFERLMSVFSALGIEVVLRQKETVQTSSSDRW